MTKVKLSKVIRRCQTRVDRCDTDLLYYVAGEHFESGEIDLAGRGKIAGSTIGPMFYYGFKPGDFLLVSRNPHLRKASRVDFAGICSEKTFVLETADEGVLLSEYLPWVLQNDRFWGYAQENRHGSTNFFINWSTLADYEFELPPIENQKRIAAILWAAQSVRRNYRKLLKTCDDVVKSQFIEIFGGPNPAESDCPSATIGELATDVRYGTSKKASDGGEFKYLRMNNMTDDGGLDLSDLKYIDLSGAELENAKVVKGDLLFNRTNSREKVGKTCVFNENEPMVIAGYIVRVRFNEHVEPGYVSAFLNSNYGKRLLRKMAKGAVGQANISAKEMAKIELPLPPIELQRSFLDFAASVDKSKFRLGTCGGML